MPGPKLLIEIVVVQYAYPTGFDCNDGVGLGGGGIILKSNRREVDNKLRGGSGGAHFYIHILIINFYIFLSYFKDGLYYYGCFHVNTKYSL